MCTFFLEIPSLHTCVLYKLLCLNDTAFWLARTTVVSNILINVFLSGPAVTENVALAERAIAVDTTGLTAEHLDEYRGIETTIGRTIVCTVIDPPEMIIWDDRSLKLSCFKRVPITSICTVNRRWAIFINIFNKIAYKANKPKTPNDK